MRNPVACLLWLEGSPVLETRPIDELDKLLSKPEDAGLRRAFALWVTTIFCMGHCHRRSKIAYAEQRRISCSSGVNAW